MATETVDLFNPHGGLTGRDGGPYLDEVERRNAEAIRAAKEGREPDFDNAPATAGTPLVTGAVLANVANPASNPSMQTEGVQAVNVSAIAKNKDTILEVFATREKTEQEVEAAKTDTVNPADPTVASKDESDKPAKPATKKAAAKKTAAKSEGGK